MVATISSVIFGGTQTSPSVTITGSGFGSAPQGTATSAGSGASGTLFGTSLFIVDQTQNFSAGLTTPLTNNSIGLTNVSYSDTSIYFTFGNAYPLFLYNFTQGDSVGVSVAGAYNFTTVNYSPALTASTIGIARFFDSGTGTHFYTTSATEVQQVLNTRPDLKEEATSFNAYSTNQTGTAPVYRFFDTTFGTHFFTESAVERNMVASTRSDLVYEGVGFNEHTTQQKGDLPVYRFFDTTNGTHFYTASALEISNIAGTRGDLKAEGIAFYAPST